MDTFRTKVQGLSLLETIIAMLILTLSLWSIQTAFVGLLRGTTKNEARQKASAAAESLFLTWKDRARTRWTQEAVEGMADEYFYRLDVSDLVADPLAVTPGEKLRLRLIKLKVYYADHNDVGLTSNAETPLWVELQGSVAR